MSKYSVAETMLDPFFFLFQVKVQFEAYIFLNGLIVGARATALARGATISMPPVPIVSVPAA
jgi:hypothetical protein